MEKNHDKRALILTVCFTLLLIGLWINKVYSDTSYPNEQTVKDEKQESNQCPRTKMTKDCLTCHTTPNFKIKESNKIKEVLEMPPGLKLFTDGNNALYFYYLLDSIEPNHIRNLFTYMDEHPNLPRKLVIEIHSTGGHAFDGWRIVNIIQSYWDKYEIETHLHGMAFSAGFMIFEAGEKRLCSPTSELMWHEISFYELLEKVTPKGTEDKLNMIRHLQDNANAWLAERSNGKTSKESIDNRCSSNTGWWFNGKQALEYGFADGLLITK